MTATTPWYVQHSDVGRAYQHFANAVKETVRGATW